MKSLFITPPSQELRDQRIVVVVLLVSLVATSGLAIAGINRNVMILLSFSVAVGLALALRGQLRAAGILTPLISLLLITYLIFRNNGLRDTAVLGLPAVIIAASLLNGRWGAITFGLASLLIIFTLGVAEMNGLIPTSFRVVNTIYDYVTVALLISVIIFLQWAALERLTQGLQMAQLELDERTRTEKELKQRAEEMSLLYRLGTSLTSGEGLYHSLRAFVKELQTLMIVDTFYVVMYDEQTDIVSYPLYLTYKDDLHFPPRKLSDNPGLTGAVISSRKTLAIPDITLPAMQEKYQIVIIVDLDIHSYVGIPLMMNDRIIGVVSIQARQPNAYSSDQVRMLETLATQVAITVEKARLFEQLQQELAERKRAEAEVRSLNIDLEERVQLRTAQLEAANKEMESFSYSVSHDLRAPLRGIDGFSYILEQEYSKTLDETGQKLISRIRESAHRMNQLINDLLTFSRLGRQELHKRVVDPAILIREVLQDFPEIENRKLTLVIAEKFPPCEADSGLLRQVFANLLDNALKYSRTRKEARIEVNWIENDGAPIYFVRDNGVGFEMQFADKLFGVFQRLHRMDEFEGTGVGLATVQRIIHRHGGRIWAEAEINQGATFYFTLPYKVEGL